LYWNGPDSGTVWEIVPASAFLTLNQSTYDLDIPTSIISDYEVRVKVADAAIGVEKNCKQYPNGNYKPVGLLQRHGESDSMYFGLLSGSYTKNTSGGVLRKKIGTITDEINAITGQFTATNGIISTIDQFRIVDFRYGYDADAATVDTIREFHPTYICMDVTDPRTPRLLWERSYENLAMSASYPAAVAVGKAKSLSGTTYSWSAGTWMVAFGSGPTDYDGRSNQNGYMFVVDL
jgi:Tfp pilus tip-associated adhesin PilY1